MVDGANWGAPTADLY